MPDYTCLVAFKAAGILSIPQNQEIAGLGMRGVAFSIPTLTVYIHFESIHCIRIVSLNFVYFRLIFQVWCLLSSAITIDPQVFAVGCKSKRLHSL